MRTGQLATVCRQDSRRFTVPMSGNWAACYFSALAVARKLVFAGGHVRGIGVQLRQPARQTEPSRCDFLPMACTEPNYNFHRAASAKLSRCLWVVLTVCGLGMSGCGGCQNNSQTARQQKKESQKRADQEDAKDEFEFGNPQMLPGEILVRRNAVKPGHFHTVSQSIKANHADYQADLVTGSVDRQGTPLPIDKTRFAMVTSRPAPLPKGVTKFFEMMFFIPDLSRYGKGRQVWLDTRVRSRRGGREIMRTTDLTTIMEGYQYFLVVLAEDPNEYSYIKTLDTVLPPFDEYGSDTQERLWYYRVFAPKIQNRVPLPSHPFAWTCVAYLVWDGIDPKLLAPDQQTALLDWIHWGGQVVVSGPDSLDLLRGSFLDPFLPVEKVKTIELAPEKLADMNDYWSMRYVKEKQEVHQSLDVLPENPLVGVEMRLRTPDDAFLFGTGSLVAERRVGRGRIVVSGFSLSDRKVIAWKSFDGFVNNCLFRRPRREFRQSATPRAADVAWHDLRGFERDSRTTSGLRYFSRDVGRVLGGEQATSPRRGTAQGQGTTTAQPVRAQAADPGQGPAPTSPGEKDAWRFAGFRPSPRSGVGAWNDYSGASHQARLALEDAAGINIPNASFVLRVLAVYLIALVPANWILFRLIGRVEWAWLAAPVIAVGGAVAVVRFAQLDIGFARSRTELSILEVQGGYARGHLTRYTVLYTSLSTAYDVTYDDMTSVAQPFPGAQDDRRRIATVSLRRDRQVQLSNILVESNSTERLHAEQMYDMGGSFTLQGDFGTGFRLNNGTRVKLQDAALLLRQNGRLKIAWLGEVAPESSMTPVFADAPEGQKHPVQWEQSLMTQGPRHQIQTLFQELDRNQDKMIQETEVPLEHMLNGEFEKWDASADDRVADGRLDFEEVRQFVRNQRRGTVRLGRLFELVEDRLELLDGEVRLMAWTDQAPGELAFLPMSSQVETRMFVLVHLRHKSLPQPERDYNTKLAVVDPTMDEAGQRVTLGLTAQDMTQQMSEALGVRTETGEWIVTGALITRVEPGGPADKIGLQPNDVIVGWGGMIVQNNKDLRAKLVETKANDTIEIDVIRAGQGRQTRRITVRESFPLD